MKIVVFWRSKKQFDFLSIIPLWIESGKKENEQQLDHD